MRILLDTNVISEVVSRKPNGQVLRWLDALDPASVFLSVVTIGEIQRGVDKLPDGERRDRLNRWLSEDLILRFDQRILTVDVATMLAWGSLAARRERTGQPMSAFDMLIAAIAIRYDCSLATRNTSHFGDTGVTLINPWSAVS